MHCGTGERHSTIYLVQICMCGRMHAAKTRGLFLERLSGAKASEAAVGVIWEIAKGPENQQVPISQTRQTSITELSKWNQINVLFAQSSPLLSLLLFALSPSAVLCHSLC